MFSRKRDFFFEGHPKRDTGPAWKDLAGGQQAIVTRIATAGLRAVGDVLRYLFQFQTWRWTAGKTKVWLATWPSGCRKLPCWVPNWCSSYPQMQKSGQF